VFLKCEIELFMVVRREKAWRWMRSEMGSRSRTCVCFACTITRFGRGNLLPIGPNSLELFPVRAFDTLQPTLAITQQINPSCRQPED
jgi:hypothetical protein